MDFFDILIGAVSVALVPLGWYIKGVSARIKEVEGVNRVQSDKLSALELYIVRNHPDNADFQKLTETVEKLVSAVNDLRADVRGLMSRG
jgi:hypothetical protein